MTLCSQLSGQFSSRKATFRHDFGDDNPGNRADFSIFFPEPSAISACLFGSREPTTAELI